MSTNANDIIRSVLGYTYTAGGKPMSNVLHWRDTGGGGITDADFIGGFGAAIEAMMVTLLPQQGSAWKYINITLQNLTQNLLIATLVWPTFTEGTAVSAIDTAQTSLLLRMLTAKPRVQGRVNIGGIAEGGIISSAFSTLALLAGSVFGIALLIPISLGTGEITYTVFDQVFKTDNLPTSSFVGNTTRGLNRRKLA